MYKNLLKSLFVLLLLTLFTQCDNDDGNAPNQNQCNYAGLTIKNPSNNTQTLIPESDLTTTVHKSGNDVKSIEIFKTSDPDGFTFRTKHVTLNAMGAGYVNSSLLTPVNNTVTVTCQRAGTNVGNEYRYDIVFTNGAEGELCVVIDNVNP